MAEEVRSPSESTPIVAPASVSIIRPDHLQVNGFEGLVIPKVLVVCPFVQLCFYFFVLLGRGVAVIIASLTKEEIR